MKGDGPLSYHLGCDFFRDPDGSLAFGPKKYVTKMMSNYERMFGELPRKYKSPLDHGDHPELDTSPLLEPEDVAKYHSMIGALQWLVSLGRFDVLSATVTLSRFRAEPREGHLARAKHVYGYIRSQPDGAIRVRTGLPDYSELPYKDHDWDYSVYGSVEETIPSDAPEPLGKEVILSTYVDANLYHDMVTGRALTGVLHFVNGTPVEWFSKRQATVETATYGSEFVAAKIATEQVIDLRTSIRYLGIPIKKDSYVSMTDPRKAEKKRDRDVPTYMFGDNQSVITSSTIPASLLNKRHNALAYHRVREAIAAGIIRFFHIAGKSNPADVLSKHSGFQQFWPLIQPILFWRGDPTSLKNSLLEDRTDPKSVSTRESGECQEKNGTASRGSMETMREYGDYPGEGRGQTGTALGSRSKDKGTGTTQMRTGTTPMRTGTARVRTGTVRTRTKTVGFTSDPYKNY